ncbi:MAG TPA: carbamoyl-phosphate synthase large subunit, partial [Vicinamibacterales bacterium]|nr:carbamoyl-phosphate synthase large subunit [Vicinamibacterales bacterium]
EGYRIVLVNSNPATIMTDPELADATYVEPITPEVVAKIIETERPDALLPTMGGQTALNTALSLARDGVLEKFGVEMIGAKAEAIDKAEDRKLFREAMDRIGLESPRAAIASSPAIRDAQGHIVGYDRATGFIEAMRSLDKVGLPAIIRPAFTLGGTGGGVAYNRDEFEQIVRTGLDASPAGQILIDESLLGWKEFEMEVVRDKADNCIIVCSIENLDPMGVHTGDSITVAPAQTLTDKEYQIMRNASLAVLREIGLECPRAAVAHTLQQAVDIQQGLGFPCVIRPSFTMGGSGGGIAYNREEFEQIVERGLDASPTSEVLIEESVIGWKEFEMEVVRDKNDNCIIVCSIENLDPMGVHTGDSITVAPAQTLTDKEYQRMRNASIAVLRKIGVDTGGSNVQFAVSPKDGRLLVIEMNPRVSRSSALASKATGFPIAKIAAKLAVGYTLDELKNDITGGATPASFEPTIDYVVTKIPRFTFEKFPAANSRLTTQMKSVGEVMAIGRTFQESLQKALRGLETGLDGLNEQIKDAVSEEDRDKLAYELRAPGPNRLLYVADAFRAGWSRERIEELSYIDPWFLAQIEELVVEESRVREGGVASLETERLRELKRRGFSDSRLGHLTGAGEEAIRAKRHALNIRPVYKRVDTCAAEFATSTAYLYSTYEEECEAAPTNKRKIMILGGGPNRIGQGIEFDYCCVHAALQLREDGFETIMVNCNPETVSTDYDTSDRLYFEPLTLEDVLEVMAKEKPEGVIVQFGGQTPLKLSRALEDAGAPIIGTTPESIDVAEDRERFQQLV